MKYFTLLIFLICQITTCLIAQPTVPSAKTIQDFRLKNIDNSYISFGDFKKAKGFIIVFTCNHCPFAKLYPERLNKLYNKYIKKDVPLLALNSMDTLVYEDESFDLMKIKAITEKWRFPYLYDETQEVGKLFGAEHTPQAFVIWKVNNKWEIKYSGAIDDNGEQPELATPFIANAVEDLLRGGEVLKPFTDSFGCRIFYRK